MRCWTMLLTLMCLTGELTAQTLTAQTGRATLICRMGGGMVWSVVSQLDAISTQINGKNVKVPVITAQFAQLIFGKSKTPVAADGTGLASGSCGWTDRGMTAAEPGRVVQDVSSATIHGTVLWGKGSTVGGATTLSGGDLDQPNHTVFTMQVTRGASADVQFRVVPGTKVKVLGK